MTPALTAEKDWRSYSPKQLAEIIQRLTPADQEQFLSLLDEEVQDDIWEACAKWESSFDVGPLLWLTVHTKTEDLHAHDKGTAPEAPFPKKQYFVTMMDLMLNNKRLFIIKSREMMTSWLVCGYIAWMTQFLPHIFWVIQTEKDKKAIQLIEYCRILYRQQPEWMKIRNPIVNGASSTGNVDEIVRKNGSRILAVPKGENQIRLHHPHGYLMDEAAFLPEAEQCYNAASPVSKQIIAVSSDEIGWFHNECKL